ncbi:MAG: hydroxymethylglutaryl-CoA lyase [Deltaproteobacteria bacterium]|nr:hydroxymethylglutaryl-CoA lyase [Deltaproteobacteria bacterium]
MEDIRQPPEGGTTRGARTNNAREIQPVFQNLPGKVYIREVSPRDGLQAEGKFFPTQKKAELIRRLAAAGLPHIELTSFVNPKWIPALADCAEIAAMFSALEGVDTSALVPNLKGLEGARSAGMRQVNVFLSATESHNKANINKSIEETFTQFAELIPASKEAGMSVVGTISVVMGCPYEGEVPPARIGTMARRLAVLGVDFLMLGDTVGMGTPMHTARMLEAVLPQFQTGRVGLHLHDTRGMALANALTGVEMGVRCFDGSLGGLGGCPYAPGATGNVPTENLVYMFQGLGIETGIDLEALLETGEWLEKELGRELPSAGLRAYMARRKAPLH